MTDEVKQDPWLNELDEYHELHEGYSIILHRRPDGAWGCFVGVSQDHPLYGLSVEDAVKHSGTDFDIHGGFVGTTTAWDGGLFWYFEFHFAHLFDYRPNVDPLTDYRHGHKRYATVARAMNECQYAIEQLRART